MGGYGGTARVTSLWAQAAERRRREIAERAARKHREMAAAASRAAAAAERAREALILKDVGGRR